MHIIIPMSGVGKRFIDAGYKDAKPLILVEGKPIIQHIVELFPGETKFSFICNDEHLLTTNMRSILETICPGCNIYEVSVHDRRGPVHAVMQIREHIDDSEPVIVSYCDYGTKWDYSAFLHLFPSGFKTPPLGAVMNEKSDADCAFQMRNGVQDIDDFDADGAIACYRGFHPHMLGSDNYAFVREHDMNLLEIQEKKPFTDSKMDEYASNGTYYFKSGSLVKRFFQELMDKNISINNEFYVSMVYQLMVENGLKIRIFEIEKMLQWGTPKDLEEYLVWSNYFLNRKPDFNKSVVDTQNTTLILPMAGAGSRFFNVGFTTPKPLLLVEGEPMVIQAVDCLPPTTNKLFICQNEHLCNYDILSTIMGKYPESSIFGIDHVTEGQACTCEIAFERYLMNLDSPVMISACDNGVYYDIQKYNDLLLDPEVDVIVWSFSDNPTSQLYPHMYAWLDVDKNNVIQRVSIKKPFTDCENKYAIIGTMLFKKGSIFKEGLRKIYDANLRTNGEYYVDNMIEPLIHAGYRCKIFNVDNYLCWGTPNDYKTYQYWHDYFSKL